MTTFTIDGKTVEASKEENILEVARREGVPIPTLCYHPAVEPYGACRMCTVEVERNGQTGLKTSCNTRVSEGLVVRTHTPDVFRFRQALMGLLVSRCPNVPMLQELAAEYGVTEPPFPTDTPDEKCILCGLCVRVCHDVVGAKVINFSNRGIDRRVGPPFLEIADECIGCGACTLVCPTGAVEIAFEKEAIYIEKPIGPTSAIYVPALQAVPRVPVIDTDTCIHFQQKDITNGEIDDACGVCQKLCEVGAIDFEQEDEIIEFDVGAIVVATGFKMWDPTQLPEYSYSKSPNIITGLEFERLTGSAGPTAGEILTAEGKKPEKVAIVHCVGSRSERSHSYCSRFCCMYSLKQAHQIKDKTGAEVYSIYMDMRTFGKDYEEFYRRIREEGIQFIQGRPSQITVDPINGRLYIDVEDILLGQAMELDVDMVVLATAIEPPENADEIASTFGLGRTPDGWFAEAHPKLRPVETATAGVFLAGCAQGPRDVPDTVAHAGAAASEVVCLFNQGEVTISPMVAEVNPVKCAGCGECTLSCPYTAIWRNVKEKAEVNPALCKGCGTCVAACPSGAITALHFTNDEIVAQIDGLLALMV
jgi:heterodisulfide reductase subunit A